MRRVAMALVAVAVVWVLGGVGASVWAQRDVVVVVWPQTEQPRAGAFLPVWCVNAGVVTTPVQCTVLASYTQVPVWGLVGGGVPRGVAWMEIRFDALTVASLNNPAMFIGLQNVLVPPLPGKSGGWIRIPDSRALVGVGFYLQGIVHAPWSSTNVTRRIVIQK